MENAVKDGFTYDAEAVVLPVKCTGLVKVSYLLKLFAKGMQGVLVLGCDEGDCRYYNGSARCAEIVDETREILDLAGITRDRLQFHLIAESGGGEVKRVLKTFLKQFGVMTRKAAKGDGRGKRVKAKAAKPKAKPAREIGKKPKRAAKPSKKRTTGKPKAKPSRSKPAGKASKKSKPKRAVKKSRKTADSKRSAGTRKTTGGTRTVKARKGKKRGSSRRH
jgi:coenzyme F420-reducing hydrogenase delta subunit